jgi:hypothetical protein
MIVVDDERALAARGEVGLELSALVSGIDDKRLDRGAVGHGDVALAGDGRHRGPPCPLFLLGGVFPRREGGGVGSAMGFVGDPGQAFDMVSTAHVSMMPNGRSDGSRSARYRPP